MLVTAEILLLGRSGFWSVGRLVEVVIRHALEFEGTELLVDDLPYYLVGCHSGYEGK